MGENRKPISIPAEPSQSWIGPEDDPIAPPFSAVRPNFASPIFDEKTASERAKPRQPGARKLGEGEETPAPETLAIDVSELKKRGSERRLNHSSDFAYLLDALIYHLQIREDRSLEERDKYGRNEEEQIGSDDDASDPVQQMTTAEQASLLSACHAKVGTLVRRMVLQLEAYSENRLSLQEVLVRLLGVLAVFRELRRCDGRVSWIEKGKTTVPEEQRMRLLHGIMFNLFERNPSSGGASLLNLKPLGEEFQESDDLARLKGLVLWLPGIAASPLICVDHMRTGKHPS